MNSARLPVIPARLATWKPYGFLAAWTAGFIVGTMPQRVPTV
jgi:hypothetical protein